MVVIFMLSHQSGEASSETSGVVEQLLQFFSFIPSHIFGMELQFVIRKAAHMIAYFILAGLSYRAFSLDEELNRSLVLSLIVVFIYACTDAYHQTFIVGRAGALSDVLIDTVGGSGFIILRLMYEQVLSQSALKVKGKLAT